MFKVGDPAYYRDHTGTVSTGTVIQIGGGKDGTLTEVYWPDMDQATWFETERLWERKPDWSVDQPCVCGCPFGEHVKCGCVLHQIHEFEPAL